MSGLRRLPFRHQLMLVTILASATALVLASAGLLYYEAARSRREEERDLQSLARVVATNSMPMTEKMQDCPKLKTLSIGNLLAEAIKRIHNEDSVSSLFEM